MAGASGQWKDIAADLPGQPTTVEVKERLDAIVNRRNGVVHEGDYERLERPQNAKLSSLTAGEVNEDIEFLSQLVEAIHGNT